MKIGQRWRENLVSAMGVPRDLACQEAVVTVTGSSQAVIENYRGILRYTPDEIVILTLRGKVTISGKRLGIRWYTAEEMFITGCFSGIFLE